MELTYDQEGKPVGSGQRGASLAVVGEGPHSRVLKARSGLGEFALKVQKEDSPASNREVWERWHREYRALLRQGTDGPGLLAPEPLGGFETDEGPPRFLPLFLCREKGRVFHLPCPACMKMSTLTDCRDEGALSATGLPSWSESRERFLWCESCGPTRPVFFSRKPRKGPEPVEDLVALVRALRPVVDRGEDREPIPDALLAELDRDFPCMGCEHRAACYPREAASKPGLAESRLTPVCFHDFFAIPVPLCELELDEAADLLSGADARELSRRHGRDWSTPARRRLKEAALARGGPSSPIAALRAKLDLLSQAARATTELHAEGEPHLHLSPEHVLVRLAEGDPVVKLISPGAPKPLRELFLPPADAAPPYAAPAIAQAGFARPIAARVHVGKVWSATGDTFFGAMIEGDGLPVEDVREDDEVRIVLDLPGWEDTVLWARALPGDGDEGPSLAVATTPAPLTAAQVNDLQSAKGKSPLFGSATVFRSFGFPFDVHSLGMLLFRALLVNESQDFDRVLEALVDPLTAGLELFARNRPDSGHEAFRAMIAEETGREPVSRAAASANVWARPAEAPEGAIPAELWTDLLTTGFRAVTRIPGFSFCPSDRDPGETPPAKAFLDELERIARALVGVPEPAHEAGEAPIAAVEEIVDEVVAAKPLTDSEIREITGEVESELQEQIEELRERLAASEAAREILAGAWSALYEGVSGSQDREGPPAEEGDPRVPILATTMEETIDCITQVFRGIASFAGDELGENVPKIRMMIQDALRDVERGEEDVERRLKKVKRQLRVIRMFLFGVVQVFLEAHSHSTKLGTKSLLRLIESGLFEPVVKGKREREPDAAEIRRRFQQISETLPEKYQRVFQPFFQEYVREKLKTTT